MVSLRDGKSYDANSVTPKRHRATRRSTRRELTPDSIATLESQPDSCDDVDSELVTPAGQQNRGSKRGRAAQQQQLESIADQCPHSPDTADGGQETLQLAADTQLPSPASCSPAPKKKARTSQPDASSKLTTSLAALAILVVIAILALILWPYHGTVGQSINGAVQATGNRISNLRLLDKLSDLEQSAAAAAGALVQLLQAHASDIQRQIYVVLRQLHVKYPSVVPDGWRSPVGTADPKAWPSEVLDGILPSGSRWRELSVDITDKLRTPAAQRSYKATAVILACATAEDCSHAATTLSAMPPRGAACSLLLNATNIARDTEQPAAALQATLAQFLRRCPTGLVLLQQVEQLPVAAVPALHNALSELGGFQYSGTVHSSSAAYILLMQMPIEYISAVSTSPEPSRVADDIKDAFFVEQRQLLQQQRLQQHDSAAREALAAVDRILTTLHRRIDFAAPIRLGAAAEAELRDVVKAQGTVALDGSQVASGPEFQEGDFDGVHVEEA